MKLNKTFLGNMNLLRPHFQFLLCGLQPSEDDLHPAKLAQHQSFSQSLSVSDHVKLLGHD